MLRARGGRYKSGRVERLESDGGTEDEWKGREDVWLTEEDCPTNSGFDKLSRMTNLLSIIINTLRYLLRYFRRRNLAILATSLRLRLSRTGRLSSPLAYQHKSRSRCSPLCLSVAECPARCRPHRADRPVPASAAKCVIPSKSSSAVRHSASRRIMRAESSPILVAHRPLPTAHRRRLSALGCRL